MKCGRPLVVSVFIAALFCAVGTPTQAQVGRASPVPGAGRGPSGPGFIGGPDGLRGPFLDPIGPLAPGWTSVPGDSGFDRDGPEREPSTAGNGGRSRPPSNPRSAAGSPGADSPGGKSISIPGNSVHAASRAGQPTAGGGHGPGGGGDSGGGGGWPWWVIVLLIWLVIGLIGSVFK